jgi:hypothetical protein
MPAVKAAFASPQSWARAIAQADSNGKVVGGSM